MAVISFCRCYSDEPSCWSKCWGDISCHDICFHPYEYCNRETFECNRTGPQPSCMKIQKHCGKWDDGQGGVLDCGVCPNGEVCNNGGCASCKPWSCDMIGAECGEWHAGCGDESRTDNYVIVCGKCPAGESCNEFARCEAGELSAIGDPCPLAGGVHENESNCALGSICIGEHDLGACADVADCGLPAEYHPECHDGACGYSFCSQTCDFQGCPSGFINGTFLGACYCFPEQ